MSVGRVKGGRSGGTGKAAGAGKASGGGFAGKVGGNAAVEKASGLVGAGAASGVAAADPVTAQALDIARQLKNGQIKTKEEATRKLVADILREKVRMQSKALTQKIADQLQDDPRLSQALESLWSKAQ